MLLDLRLPGSGGIELMQTLPELAHLPVIFISAYGCDETVARALEAGEADYIVKPFSPTELVARICAVLRRHVEPEAFVPGDLPIAHDRHWVSVTGRTVALDPDGVRAATGAHAQCGPGDRLRDPAGAGLERTRQRRHQDGARPRQAAARQARRRRRRARLDLQSARIRQPHAPAGRAVRTLPPDASDTTALRAAASRW